MTSRHDRLHYGDQVQYSTAAVEMFLPSVWDAEWILSAKPPRGAATGVRSKVDPRHIPDYLLAAADVQVGYRKAGLDNAEKECLRHVHHLGYTPGELSNIWGVPSEQVHRACLTGIDRIAQYLNGRVPA